MLCRRQLSFVGGMALFILSASLVQAAGLKALPARVPEAIARLNLKPVGNLAGTTQLHLAIGLPLHNQEALTNLLQQLYDPASPNYHHYLAPEQFTQMFGPSEQEYQDVIAFAKAHGLTVTGTYSNRVLVDVSGSVANVQNAFHVTMKVYQHPTENRTFFAPDTEPSVDANLPILSVQGMNSYIQPHPMSHKMLASTINPSAGSGPGGTYMGSDFRKAYAPDTTLNGSGQIVGLLQFDGYHASDITTYESLAGLPNVPLENVLLDGFDGSAGGANDEVCLDIEASIAMAPGLSKVVVFEAGPYGNPNDILSSMVARSEIKQFSASWGYTIDGTTEGLYQQLAAQGQTFLNASGDGDAWLGPIPYGCLEDPNITLVGGTTLTMSGAGVSYLSERVLNWGYNGTSWNPDGYFGSSGGISTDVSIPVWQQGISMAANHGSTTMRNMPDVALTGDNVFVVYDNGSEGGFGGTSCASPLWAGFMALVNQQAAAHSKPSVGFLAPTVYAIAKTANYANCFHDIVLGDNTWPGSPTNFFAVSGYDLCTGLGTPKGANLINALVPTARNGFLTVNVVPLSGSALLQATAQQVFVTVNDVYAVTNATVTGTIPGVVTNLAFLEDGALDGIYSNTFTVPATGPLTMTVRATATNEIGVTNVVYYSVIGVPPNDNFTNATKVSVAGGSYVENNRFATLELGEPKHDGDQSDTGSLWWAWTPTANTNVFIDTVGSKAENVLAVYTGSTLANLQSVTATNSSLTLYKPAQIRFNAQANTTYHIAVASASSNSLGTLVFHVTPGGQPDTNAPVVSVTSPQSGLTVFGNVIAVVGAASDPGSNPSGVSQVFVTVNGSSLTAVGTTNWTTLVALQPELNIIKVTAVDEAGNFSATTTIEVNYLILPPANDFFVNATALSGTSGTVSGDSTNATKEVGEPNPAGNTGGKSLWWSFTPSTDGILELSTSGSTFDTIMGLYTGTNVASLTTIVDNDDAYSGAPGGFSGISQAVRANQTYYILVDGYNGASGAISLSYAFFNATVYHVTAASSGGGTVQLSTTNQMGGIAILPSTSADFWSGWTAVLTAFPDHNDQFDMWSNDVVSLNNPLSVVVNSDLNITANFVSRVFTDGFESGNLSHLSWITAGDAPWFVQTNVVDVGQYAAQSGVIGNSQSSSLIFTTNFVAGTGSFDFKISSEQNWDTLSFYVDTNLLARWSGAIDWANYSFPLTAGTHTLEWTYSKDATISMGLDAAFLDDVILPLAVIPSIATPAQIQLQQQTDGGLFMNLSGQSGQQYVIQASTDLVHWQNISTNIASGGFIRILLPSSGTNQAQFYRAVAP